jgi:SNF2 family DNA or RNA helicase
VLDLPEVREVTRTCELPANARKMYRDLDRDLFTDLQAWEAGELQAANVMVKLLRLAQLTGGHIKDDDGVEIEVHTAKADLLTEVLEDISPEESVVVFCRFTPDLDTVRAVAAKMSRPYAELSGRRSDALTEDATLRLDHGISAVQIQAGGTGVDFTKSAIGIDYSVGYSRIDFEQSRKRLHRPGQERPVLFIHLVVERTVDEDIYTSLADDNFTIESVMKRRLTAARDGGANLQAHAVADALNIFGGGL